jgi:hypothetical protein
LASYQPTEPRSPARHRSLPPGLAWDNDAKSPGVIIRSVDPLLAERCPLCHRPYQSEEPPRAEEGARAILVALLRLLIESAREHRTSRDLQVGRQLHLIAFHLGLLPECRTYADLARYLRVHPVVLSQSKRRLPPQFQAFCRLRNKPRKTGGP